MTLQALGVVALSWTMAGPGPPATGGRTTERPGVELPTMRDSAAPARGVQRWAMRESGSQGRWAGVSVMRASARQGAQTGEGSAAGRLRPREGIGGVVGRGPAGEATEPAIPAAARAGDDPWLGEDKVKHLVVSFALASFGYGLARATGLGHGAALAAGGGMAAAAGLGKEVRDGLTYHDFSLRDLAWDAVGVALGTVLAAQAR